AVSLYKAFQNSKDLCYGWLADQLPAVSLPWFQAALAERWRFFGGDPFAYGIEPNRSALETLARYSFEQRLTRRKLSVDDMFAEETRDLTREVDYATNRRPPAQLRTLLSEAKDGPQPTP